LNAELNRYDRQRVRRSESGRPFRVLTNMDCFGDIRVRDRPVTPTLLPDSSRRRFMRRLLSSRWDAVLLNGESHLLFAACAVKKLLPWRRFRIMSVDLILEPRPITPWRLLRFNIRRWLLREVDRLVLYYRDTERLRTTYDLAPDVVRFVPFKVNDLARIRTLNVSDDGYFLACGRSHRDYDTLIRAFAGTPHRCVILARREDLTQHGTVAGGAEALPDNVEWVSDDGSLESWNDWLARAHAVVLPLIPGWLSPAGVSAYLVAMAMGKCVIITEGPSTVGLVDDGQAVIVPPRDVERLRDAVDRVAIDADYRNKTAEAGRSYALSVGGTPRLIADVRSIFAEMVMDRPNAGFGSEAVQLASEAVD
jgi:glycosyltransferase involved in cell wall biosynthesis